MIRPGSAANRPPAGDRLAARPLAADPPEWLLHPPVIRARYARRFAARQENSFVLVATEAIDWLEASGRGVLAHAGGERHLLPKPIGRMEALLDPRRFARIHRSIIVNLTRIASLKASGHREYVVALRDGTELRSSRSYAPRIRQLLGLKPGVDRGGRRE